MKKNFIFKRVLTLVLAVMMLVTAMPVGVLADPGAAGTQNKKKYTDDDYSITYNDKIIRKADYINKVDNLPIEPVKTKNAETLVKYPKQPERYTVRADFKVERVMTTLLVTNHISQLLEKEQAIQKRLRLRRN